MNKFNYKWNIKDGYPAPGTKKHEREVFSTFACGGGSSMGYKLAGYNVIGANDIDPKMRDVYITNHNPKYYILGSISEMKTMDLPEELFDLDILDGSPPCSTFSMAGSREKSWKKNKRFREGQSEQVLSDLFFDFIDVAERLQPKVIIAENVKGMLIGNAKLYTKEIVRRFNKIGYEVQVFLLNAASMGVPQKRERVFFICHKRDLDLPKLKLRFNENPISFKTIRDESDNESNLTKKYLDYWEKAKEGSVVGKYQVHRKARRNEPLPTIEAGGAGTFDYEVPRTVNDYETMLASSFPLDYNYAENEVKYICGMSVPPVMMAQVANQVYEQWLSKLED